MDNPLSMDVDIDNDQARAFEGAALAQDDGGSPLSASSAASSVLGDFAPSSASAAPIAGLPAPIDIPCASADVDMTDAGTTGPGPIAARNLRAATRPAKGPRKKDAGAYMVGGTRVDGRAGRGPGGAAGGAGGEDWAGVEEGMAIPMRNSGAKLLDEDLVRALDFGDPFAEQLTAEAEPSSLHAPQQSEPGPSSDMGTAATQVPAASPAAITPAEEAAPEADSSVVLASGALNATPDVPESSPQLPVVTSNAAI